MAVGGTGSPGDTALLQLAHRVPLLSTPPFPIRNTREDALNQDCILLCFQ